MTWRAMVMILALAAGCASQPQPAAPVIDRTARSAPAAPPVAKVTAPTPRTLADGEYEVKRGDTLYSIALEHGADYREVALWNSLEDPTRIRVGQVLRVKPPEPEPGKAVVSRIESRPLESRPLESRPLGAPAAAKAPAAAAQAKEAPSDFIWPAKGKVLAGFSEPRSKGIDIDGRLGDPVVAAAPGRVTYTGTGIPGLGKLVVIKHDNGYITVYAHNRDILVKEQQSVARGQKIAELGASDADRPKLHFQIRKGSAAVDPLRYLPAL
jgi:lipoprotein NlpD